MKSVVVFDRNSDPVRNNPEGIAKKLFSGEYRPFRGTPVNLPETVGVLSLWTRDPRNLLENRSLNRALKEYREMGILLELQISVTGFGGRFSFLELGVATPEDIYQETKKIVASKLIDPGMLKIRLDPVYSVRIPTQNQTWLVTNMRLDLFEHLADMFSTLGIQRFLSSHRDVGDYDPKKKRILERFSELGITLVEDDRSAVIGFFKEATKMFRSRGLDFGLCANPPNTSLVYQACIDSGYYMRNLPDLRLSGERNIDRNRPCCRCYRGVASIMVKGGRCYPNAQGCLICYSQGGSLSKAHAAFVDAISKFRNDASHFAGSLPRPYRDMVATL